MSHLVIPVLGGNGYGGLTASAGTLINCLLPPRRNAITRLVDFLYTSGATAHTVTAFRELGRTTTAQAEEASATSLTLSAQPTAGNNVATNDWFVWENADGTFGFGIATGASGLVVTVPVPKAVAAGAVVWHLGITTDVSPLDPCGLAHPKFAPAVSANTAWTSSGVGIVAGLNRYSPILLQSSNGTNAGTIQQASYAHTNR